MALRFLLVPELMAPASMPIELLPPTVVVTDQPMCSGTTIVRTSFVGNSSIVGRHTPELFWAARNASVCSSKQARLWVDKPSAAPRSPTPATPGTSQLIVLVQCIGKNPCVVQRFADKGKFDIVPPGSVQQICPLDILWLVRGICPLRLCVLKASSDVPRAQPESREILNAMIVEAIANADLHSDRGAALCCGPIILQCSPGGTHVSSSIPQSRPSTGMLASREQGKNSSLDDACVVIDGSSSKKRERSIDSQPVLIAPPAASRSGQQDGSSSESHDDENAARQLRFSVLPGSHQSESQASSADDLGGCDSQLARLEAFAGVMQSTKPLTFFPHQHVNNRSVAMQRGTFEAPAVLLTSTAGAAPESQLVFFDHNA